MCWAYRVAAGDIAAINTPVSEPFVGRINRAGQETAVLMMKGGQPTWVPTRYGVQMPASGGGRQMVWNARDDKLKTLEQWSRLIRMRHVIPIDAFVENVPEETWYTGAPAWLIGLHDPYDAGGAVTITEQSGADRRPVVTDAAGARAWLQASQWDVIPTLGRINRIAYAEADLFESTSLSTDARTRVPLRRAA